MKLATQQTDRAAGVLLGQAIGDALGVPYEFTARITAGQARMVGGGLGPYAPGEWSDDTQMALCIARVTATGSDLTTDAALDAVAQAFLDWQADGASDIGNQTRSVLNATRLGTGPLAERMTEAALSAARDGRAGNGALMRTGIVGLVALDNPDKTAAVARRSPHSPTPTTAAWTPACCGRQPSGSRSRKGGWTSAPDSPSCPRNVGRSG